MCTMDPRVSELFILAVLSMLICTVAVFYEHRFATTLFAALTGSIVVIARRI